jgi:hypothetical protein
LNLPALPGAPAGSTMLPTSIANGFEMLGSQASTNAAADNYLRQLIFNYGTYGDPAQQAEAAQYWGYLTSPRTVAANGYTQGQPVPGADIPGWGGQFSGGTGWMG